MATKHTPGPWGLFRDWIVTVNADGSIPLHASIVADNKGFGRPADRRLACAAPDLLEACKSAEGLFDLDAPIGQMLRAAIAKAEGR